jgi:hypothetical protein
MTEFFVKQKTIGRWFEALMEAEIYNIAGRMGYEVKIIDTDKRGYQQKKGTDRLLILIKPDGSRFPCNFEFKIDLMSQDTGNVYLDLDSIAKSDSPIWAYGLPEGEKVKVTYKGLTFESGRTIKVYTMFHDKLAPYAQNLPATRRGGEFRVQNPTPEKTSFLGQDFVKHWSTINLN